MSIIVCAFEAQKDETPEAGGGHAHARNGERALKTSGVVGSSFFITLYCFFWVFLRILLAIQHSHTDGVAPDNSPDADCGRSSAAATCKAALSRADPARPDATAARREPCPVSVTLTVKA